MITFLIPTYNEFSNIELIVNKINSLYLKESYNILFIDCAHINNYTASFNNDKILLMVRNNRKFNIQ